MKKLLDNWFKIAILICVIYYLFIITTNKTEQYRYAPFGGDGLRILDTKTGIIYIYVGDSKFNSINPFIKNKPIESRNLPAADTVKSSN